MKLDKQPEIAGQSAHSEPRPGAPLLGALRGRLSALILAASLTSPLAQAQESDQPTAEINEATTPEHSIRESYAYNGPLDYLDADDEVILLKPEVIQAYRELVELGYEFDRDFLKILDAWTKYKETLQIVDLSGSLEGTSRRFDKKRQELLDTIIEKTMPNAHAWISELKESGLVEALNPNGRTLTGKDLLFIQNFQTELAELSNDEIQANDDGHKALHLIWATLLDPEAFGTYEDLFNSGLLVADYFYNDWKTLKEKSTQNIEINIDAETCRDLLKVFGYDRAPLWFILGFQDLIEDLSSTEKQSLLIALRRSVKYLDSTDSFDMKRLVETEIGALALAPERREKVDKLMDLFECLPIENIQMEYDVLIKFALYEEQVIVEVDGEVMELFDLYFDIITSSPQPLDFRPSHLRDYAQPGSILRVLREHSLIRMALMELIKSNSLIIDGNKFALFFSEYNRTPQDVIKEMTNDETIEEIKTLAKIFGSIEATEWRFYSTSKQQANGVWPIGEWLKDQEFLNFAFEYSYYIDLESGTTLSRIADLHYLYSAYQTNPEWLRAFELIYALFGEVDLKAFAYSQERTNMLLDPRSQRLADIFHKEAPELEISPHTFFNLFVHLDTFEDPAFWSFLKALTESHERLYLSEFNIGEYVELYENPERDILHNGDFVEFARKAKLYGVKTFSIDVLVGLIPLFESNPDLFEQIESLEDTYDFSLEKTSSFANLLNINSEFTSAMTGIDKDFERLAFIIALIESGQYDILMSEEAVSAYKDLNETFDFSVSLNELLAWTVAYEEGKKLEFIKSKRFLKFWDKTLAKHVTRFQISRIDDYINLFRGRRKVEQLDEILSGYPYSVKVVHIDIHTLRDLSRDRNVIKQLRSTTFKQFIEELEKNHRYEFKVDDYWALCTLIENPELNARVFDAEFRNEMSIHFTGNLSLSDWIEIAIQVDTQEMYSFLSDGDALSVFDKVRTFFGLHSDEMNPDELPTLKAFYDDPKLLEFARRLQALILGEFRYDHAGIRYNGPSVFRSLPFFLAWYEHPEAFEMAAATRENGYRFYIGDADAWVKISSEYSQSEISEKAAEFKTLNGTNGFQGKDFFFWLGYQNFETLDATHTGLATLHEDEIHRNDSNFLSWGDYGNFESLSLAEANKALALSRAFSQDRKLRKSVGRLIRKDIKELTSSEAGFHLVFGGNGFELEEYESGHNFENGAFLPTDNYLQNATSSVVTGHLHATHFHSADYAGPSGSHESIGADIDAVILNKQDAVVITADGRHHFIVHFYTEDRTVVYLGRFKF